MLKTGTSELSPNTHMPCGVPHPWPIRRAIDGHRGRMRRLLPGVAGVKVLLPPLSFRTNQCEPIWRLCRRSTRIRAWCADLLDSVQRVRNDPEPRVHGRPLVRDVMTCQSLTAGASSEDVPLPAIARCSQRGVVVHPWHVCGVMSVVAGGRRRHTDSGPRDCSGDDEFANHVHPWILMTGPTHCPRWSGSKPNWCGVTHTRFTRTGKGKFHSPSIIGA
jgi:hypothetical protein